MPTCSFATPQAQVRCKQENPACRQWHMQADTSDWQHAGAYTGFTCHVSVTCRKKALSQPGTHVTRSLRAEFMISLLATTPPPSRASHKYNNMYFLLAGCITELIWINHSNQQVLFLQNAAHLRIYRQQASIQAFEMS